MNDWKNIHVYPLKRVIRTEDVSTRYNRIGEGSRWHYLECGHSVVCKQSCGFSIKKRCRDCWLGRPSK